VSRSREARLWELPEFFRRSVSVEKVCWAYFSSRKRSVSRATRGRRPGRARAVSSARRVEDLNGRGRARLTRRGGEPFKPQTVLLRLAGLRGGGSKSGDGQTLGTGVVSGEASPRKRGLVALPSVGGCDFSGANHRLVKAFESTVPQETRAFYIDLETAPIRPTQEPSHDFFLKHRSEGRLRKDW
jgi:hypothetical protein